MKTLAQQDKLVAQLPNGVEGMAAINRLIEMTLSGPIVIMMSWNQGVISTWRKANATLAAAAKKHTCDLLTEYISDYPLHSDVAFFESLSTARGCD